jgi:protoheme IX farnesyltransferase
MSASQTEPFTEPSCALKQPGGGLGVWLELTKPRLALMSTLTAAIGFMAAPQPIEWIPLLLLSFSIFLSAAGVLALNQWWEQATDALMHRTRDRPLPTGRLTRPQALSMGLFLIAIGLLTQWLFFHPLVLLLNLATVVSYLLVYTPLKRMTPLCTHVGAIPGALPPLIGWAAATGTMTGLGFWLFLILLFWQMPHFFAIAWLYREDYARGGIRVLSVSHPNGRRLLVETLVFSMAMVAVSLAPYWLGYADARYALFALLLMAWLAWELKRLVRAILDGKGKSNLFLFSLIYLPILLIALIAFAR